MEGFFDKENVVAKVLASASTTTQKAPAKARVPLPQPVSTEKSA